MKKTVPGMQPMKNENKVASHTISNHKDTNWDLFLKSGENKASLAKWYSQYISDTLGPALDNDQTIYISGGQEEKSVKVTNAASVAVPSLTSTMEEADGRIIFHAVVAADNGANATVVSSPDTDVCVLLVHRRQAIKAQEIYFLTGKDSKNVKHT